MADRVELEIAPREILGKKTKRLRKAGIIPANITGHNEPSQAVQIDAVLFDRLRRAHHSTSVLSLKMPDASVQTALIRHVEHAPKSGKIIHVDFSRVSLTERMTMKIPLNFVGESPAVKNDGGVLLHLVESLEVECLASDLVDNVEVDISSLTEIDGMLRAHDVKLPQGFTLLTDPEEPIAKVASTRAEVAEANAAVETPVEAAAAPESAAETPAES
ncbi:MAG: 50S ribosomal protein L25/general stress protein Ctc [Ktedonobacteraceae bacterium]